MRSFVARSGFLQSFGDIRSRLRHSSVRAAAPPSHLPSRAAAVPTQMPQRKKDSGKIYKHTHSYLQVLGNGTDTGDTTPSLLLFFDSYRYVFNVGEGFQRYCFQHRLKLGKLNDVFLTRMSTEAAGGVPGLFITLSDYGQEKGNGAGKRFNVHGPMKLREFVKALQTFVSIPEHEMSWSSFGTPGTAGQVGDPLVTNEQVEIRPIVLIPKKEEASQKMGGAVPVACYVCRLADVKGKFLPEKAKELGVIMGPDCAKLVSGVCVVGQTGRVIHPHEVMEPTVPGPTVIIVDCPDGSYSDALISSSAFESCMDGNGGEVVMVHLGPFSVVSGDAYQQWMTRFSTGVQHIFVNKRAANATAIMRDAAVAQSKLNLIDGRYFPLQKTISAQEEWHQNGVIMGKDLLQYHLKPVGKKGVDTSQLLGPFNHEEVIQSFKEEDPEALNAIHAFRERRRKCQETSASSIGPEELEITFLGTGSAIPSKYRNVTGIYLDFFGRGSMMLDCGEGSYGQLIRRFGKEGADEAIKKLKCIWISHIHADHHMGLPTLLRQHRKLKRAEGPPLLVIGPPALYSTMQNYKELEPLHFSYLFTNDTCTSKPSEKKSKMFLKASVGMLAEIRESLNLQSIDSFLVDHCNHAYGVSLISRTGWKVVFSGDTVPCASVAEHAKDATVLIHEATFEEDMKAEAEFKKHSTVRDAVRIGTEANAYRTILTHFSQRYSKIPVIEADAHAGICVAFDLMSVNLSDLEMLPATVGPCQELFKHERGEMDEQEGDLVSPLVEVS